MLLIIISLLSCTRTIQGERSRRQTSPLSCPSSTLVPVLHNGQNQFCSTPGAVGTCPSSSICLAPQNQDRVFICCQRNISTPSCPSQAVYQPSLMGYVDCSSNPAVCSFGFQCVPSSTNSSVRLCCSQNTAGAAICPNNQQILTGSTAFCIPSQPSACPAGYSCQALADPSGSFGCCTTEPTCPANFRASRNPSGSLIFCDHAVGCSAGSVCLLDPNTQLSLCCTSSAQATCADGRSTFTQTSEGAYTCSMDSPFNACPFGYSCAPSTQPGVSVCCADIRMVPAAPPSFSIKETGLIGLKPSQCPDGSSGLMESTGNVKNCHGTDCPSGYDCIFNRSMVDQYLCCRRSQMNPVQTALAGWIFG